MKSEIYRWRMRGELRAALERAARRRGVPVSKVLEIAAREWLKKSPLEAEEQRTQAELHTEAEKYVGVLRGNGGSATADRVRETVRRRVRERIQRSQKKADSSHRSE